MKTIKSLIYNIIFFTFYYFIKFISLFLKIRFLEIETRAIGHMSECIEIHILETKNKIVKKNFFDIYFCQKKIANTYLWLRWKKILNLWGNDWLKRKICFGIFNIAIKKKDSNMLIPFRHHYFSAPEKNIFWQTFDINNVLNDKEPIITFSDEEHEKAYNILGKKNIFQNDKIILLCNRDPKYRSKSNHNLSYLEYSHRDQKIEDYEEAVKYLCNLNYKVIRMGKDMHQRLNVNHKNFFDYAFSDIKNDFLDIFLFKMCNFVISSQTGLESVATLFRKKIFYVNSNELSLFQNSNYITTYPKKFFHKKSGKELNVHDLFKKKLYDNFKSSLYSFKEEFEKNNITYKNLDKSEITSAFEEIINVFENGVDQETIELNNKFKEKLSLENDLRYNYFFSKKYLKSFIN